MWGSKDSDTDDTDTKVYDGGDSSSSAHPDVSVRPVEVLDTLREAESHLSSALALMVDDVDDVARARRSGPYRSAESAKKYVGDSIHATHNDSVRSDAQTAYDFLQNAHDDAEYSFPTAYGEYRQAMDKLQAVLAAF